MNVWVCEFVWVGIWARDVDVGISVIQLVVEVLEVEVQDQKICLNSDISENMFEFRRHGTEDSCGVVSWKLREEGILKRESGTMLNALNSD